MQWTKGKAGTRPRRPERSRRTVTYRPTMADQGDRPLRRRRRMGGDRCRGGLTAPRQARFRAHDGFIPTPTSPANDFETPRAEKLAVFVSGGL